MMFSAIVYGWRNLENEKMYLGFHKTKDIHDGYINSSEDAELQTAWSYGLMQRHILWSGSVAECITLENYALKWAKAEMDWDQFYNKSVGGGTGIVKDFSNLTTEMKQVMVNFIHGIDPTPPELDLMETFNVDLVERIAEGVRSAAYPRVPESTAEIFDLPRNQVRMSIIHEDKVDQIADRMREDPATARQNVEPVIVCRYDDGSRVVIDGNHTINAAKRAGWTEVDVVYINFSDFDFNQANVDAFGYEMNHEEKVKTPNSSKDCQQAIIKIYTDLVAKGVEFNVESETFRDTVLDQLSARRWWTKQMISANHKRAVIRIKQDILNAGRNFKKWRKTDIDKLVKGIESKDTDLAVVSITSGSIYNSGVGAILNKMAGMETKRGKIIVTHANIEDYDNWSTSKKKFDNAMKAVRDTYNVDLEVLDCFA
jgi:hypothetical protein